MTRSTLTQCDRDDLDVVAETIRQIIKQNVSPYSPEAHGALRALERILSRQPHLAKPGDEPYAAGGYMTNGSKHAFPRMSFSPKGPAVLRLEGGLSKREHFAAKAMQGLLGSGVAAIRGQQVEDLAEIAVKNADALLSVLSKAESRA